MLAGGLPWARGSKRQGGTIPSEGRAYPFGVYGGEMMTENEARGRIREYIVDNFLYMRPNFAFGDEDSLLRRGVIDSLGVMEVIGFVEETWGLQVPQDEITEANFGTVAGIARYVAGRALAAS